MTTTTDLIPFALDGEGYQLRIAPEAEARKTELLALAGGVATVASNDESADAQFVSRKLAALRIEVEKHRKEVKEPINRIGKLIDATAKDFIAAVEAEEKRIQKLVGDHAMEVARVKAEKEAEERRAFDAARAARESAEAAVGAAESTGRIADILAARRAEEERMEALAARMEASAEVAGAKVADGVRFAWDFEVVNAYALAMAHPDLVRIEPKRAEILAQIKGAAETGAPMTEKEWATIGIRPFKKPIVSSR